MTEPNLTPEIETPGTMTPEEAQIVTKVLFSPTVDRMSVLTRTLIDQTQTADHACWAPLAVMERMLMNLPLAEHPVPGLAFLGVMNLALLRMASKVYDHRIAVAAALDTGGAWPEWPEWTADDTRFCYGSEAEPVLPAPLPEAAPAPAPAPDAAPTPVAEP